MSLREASPSFLRSWFSSFVLTGVERSAVSPKEGITAGCVGAGWVSVIRASIHIPATSAATSRRDVPCHCTVWTPLSHHSKLHRLQAYHNADGEICGMVESPASKTKNPRRTPQAKFGADEGTRTPGLLITNQLLYRLSYIGTQNGDRICLRLLYGAGDGNRTHAASLGSWSSTIELHPHVASTIIICSPATALQAGSRKWAGHMLPRPQLLNRRSRFGKWLPSAGCQRQGC